MNVQKPLFNKNIVITRAKNQLKEFTDILENLGARVIEFPTIKIIPPSSYEELDKAIKNIREFKWIIFTSVNGVDFFFKRFFKNGGKLKNIEEKKIAVIGPATAEAAKKKGLNIDLLPEEFKAEDVIKGFKDIDVEGVKILIPRAKKAREILPNSLREMGAKVSVIPVYETVPDDSKVSEVVELFLKQEVDLITFTSSSTVKYFMKLLKGEVDLKKIERVKIA
ncbi:MAG: uroporphyrinogen-III synthase, partial [Actinomycetia bacterium]|nr:uroporphyrinogen-III synthase [Actinomycetes bacterium]